jgi:hypothetical protein
MLEACEQYDRVKRAGAGSPCGIASDLHHVSPDRGKIGAERHSNPVVLKEYPTNLSQNTASGKNAATFGSHYITPPQLATATQAIFTLLHCNLFSQHPQ